MYKKKVIYFCLVRQLSSCRGLHGAHVGTSTQTEADFDNATLYLVIREKMIFIILLLISLTSCVCGTFVVNVTQTSYQAEEGDDITLEWSFTTKPDSFPSSLFILCEQFMDPKPLVLFDFHGGVEHPESRAEKFAERVHCDKGALRQGRIRLYVSRLRTDDSGLYVCKVRTDDSWGAGISRLNVTAAEPKPERPEPVNKGIIVLYVGVAVAVVAVCFKLSFTFRYFYKKCVDKRREVDGVV